MLDNAKKPVFVQVAEWTEDEILAGRIKEGEKIFSQNEYASFFKINAMTAARGVDLLETRGIVEKRRGIGMFVLSGAKEKILDYRKNETLYEIIDELILEGDKLGISEDEMIRIIKSRRR